MGSSGEMLILIVLGSGFKGQLVRIGIGLMDERRTGVQPPP